jgi:hypothetical protein
MADFAAKTAITEAAAGALGRGQGTFSKHELAMAAADLTDCLTKGTLARLVFEGKASMLVRGGEVQYTADQS